MQQVLAILLAIGGLRIASGELSASVPLSSTDQSYRHEVQRAIDRGLCWLRTNQHSSGWWSTPEHPAVTALALVAFRGHPTAPDRQDSSECLQRGYRYLLSCVQPDGGIHRTNLVTYNTALGLLALVAASQSEYEPLVQKARQFLINLQGDFGVKGRQDTPFDGGIGYGTKYEHSDMGNTLQALEAIYYSRPVQIDGALAETKDLDWKAAIHFLQSCQNLPSHNRESWASGDTLNKGGFIYYPGHSMAGTVTNATTGRVALRSYGSIGYGGLLSYIYADLKRDDPRVLAVFDWLQQNYTLEENPGMGAQGLYYYYHTMAKALNAYGARELEIGGKKILWPKALGQKIIDVQQRDGSWSNENGRWWEKDPALVTAYAVLSLEIIHRNL